jgi:hypothetical protein
MTLSYDVVFLALLRLVITKDKICFKRGRCIAHPFKKRAYLDFCDSLAFCSYAFAILVHGKSIDDIIDERGVKRLKARLARPFTSGMRRKALKKKYYELDKKVNEGLKLLSETEQKRLSSVDIPADCFGNIMSDILSFGLEGSDAAIMKTIGRHIGRWIYIVDASDDLADDLKKNRYNPFIYLYDGNLLTEEQKQSIATSLKLELLAAEPAFDLIDYDGYCDIEELIKNIIYRGMPNVAEKILEINGKTKKNKRK